MFKQLFSAFLFSLIILGAGCTQSSSVTRGSVEVEELQEVTQEDQTDVSFEDGNYVVPEASETRTTVSVGWTASKRVGATHHGTVDISEGALIVENSRIVSGTILVDMTTIMDLDLTDEDLNTMLVNHLKSEDFFAVDTYPTATFTISEVTKLEGIEGATHRVTGNMTIKGIENEISFPAKISQTDTGLQVTGSATLDRTLWDVKYGSEKFFDNLGDNLIEDEFMLNIDCEFSVTE